MKLEISGNKILEKYTNKWKLTTATDRVLTETNDFFMENKYFGMDKNKNTTYQNLGDAAKFMAACVLF